MLVEKLEQLVKEIKRRRKLKETRAKVDQLKRKLKERKLKMPMGKGTYGKTRGRPPAKKKMGGGLTAKQKTLPASLQKKIMSSKKKK